jgi:hypothetical protein
LLLPALCSGRWEHRVHVPFIRLSRLLAVLRLLVDVKGALIRVAPHAGSPVVLVDESPEPVVATDLAAPAWCCAQVGRIWWAETNSTTRPLRVVVADVDAEDGFEVATVEDQQPVETLRTDGSDEALGDGVRSRRPHRRLLGPDALAAENLVEGAAVLAVALADQEAHTPIAEVVTKLARLLGDPGAARVRRPAREPDATARMRDEEQQVLATQEEALD